MRPARLPGAVARRTLELAATFLGLLAVTFVIGRLVPIDPALALVGDRASASAHAQALRELGLDQPLWRQFLDYLGQVLQGDFGVSRLTSNPVAEDIARVFPATVELATLATLIGVLGGVPLGVIAALRQGTWVDHAVRVASLVGYSVPVFWFGLMGLLVFYARLDWVAGPGRLDLAYEGLVEPRSGLLLLDALLAGEWAVLIDAWRHIVLPAGILGYFSMAYLARMTRSFMLEQLHQEYVLTARVKGLAEWRVVLRHALANAAVPLVTVIALSFGHLLEGSVLTEIVFAWPGLGSYLTQALMSADMNAVLGGTVVIGVIFVGLNLLADVLYRWLDPRVR